MDMMLIAAAVSAAITFLIHFFLGGPRVAGPLLNAKDIHDVPKYINYGCWHGMSISLIFVVSAFAWAALNPADLVLAWFAFFYNIAFVIWSVGLVLWKKQSFKRIPHVFLFGTTSFLAGMALL